MTKSRPFLNRLIPSLASIGFLTRRRELVIEERPAAGRAIPKKAGAKRNDRTFFARPAGLCEAYDLVHWGGTVAPDRFRFCITGGGKDDEILRETPDALAGAPG